MAAYLHATFSAFLTDPTLLLQNQCSSYSGTFRVAKNSLFRQLMPHCDITCELGWVKYLTYVNIRILVYYLK